MSSYSNVKTKLRNRESLIAGLGEMGITPRVCDTPQRLEGYQGDKRDQTAEIIIPRAQVGSASNDIGFTLGADGTYLAIVSDYDRLRHGKQWLDRVQQEHDLQNALRIARRNGYLRPKIERSNGEIELTFTVN